MAAPVTDSTLQPYAALLTEYLAHHSSVIVVVVDSDLRIRDCSDSFGRLLGEVGAPLGRSLLDYLAPEDRGRLLGPSGRDERILLSFVAPPTDFYTVSCAVLRASDGLVVIGEQVVSSTAELIEGMTRIHEQTANLSRELHKKNAALAQARARIDELSGLLPICAYCKNIRDLEGEWHPLEEYINARSGASFSHGVCPPCEARLNDEMDGKK